MLFSDDLLFQGGTPFLLMGSLSGALRAVESLGGYGAGTIVARRLGRTLACLRWRPPAILI